MIAHVASRSMTVDDPSDDHARAASTGLISPRTAIHAAVTTHLFSLLSTATFCAMAFPEPHGMAARPTLLWRKEATRSQRSEWTRGDHREMCGSITGVCNAMIGCAAPFATAPLAHISGI